MNFLGLRCRHCGRWFGRHRITLVGDGKTNNICAIRQIVSEAMSRPPVDGSQG